MDLKMTGARISRGFMISVSEVDETSCNDLTFVIRTRLRWGP
jgi:hypothetical protein